jgi:hypothetical protein
MLTIARSCLRLLSCVDVPCFCLRGRAVSEITPSVVSVAIAQFDVDAISKSLVTLRVKPDRRRNHVAVPEARERRLARPVARGTEITHGSFAAIALEKHAASESG